MLWLPGRWGSYHRHRHHLLALWVGRPLVCLPYYSDFLTANKQQDYDSDPGHGQQAPAEGPLPIPAMPGLPPKKIGKDGCFAPEKRKKRVKDQRINGKSWPGENPRWCA